MKYKVGDHVRIKSIDWYNENKDSNGSIYCGGGIMLNPYNAEGFCGRILTIKEVHSDFYTVVEDLSYWNDYMIEGLVEEETKPKYEDEVNGEYYSTPKYLVRPSGYQFVDEKGNVINATKIVLEKKGREYPKTYEECAEIIAELTGSDCNPKGCMGYMSVQLTALQKLLICRDAYWKIAGEEMELGRPWEPSGNEDCFVISRSCGEVFLFESAGDNEPFEFPTREMRDAFYENFKELINECKELL